MNENALRAGCAPRGGEEKYFEVVCGDMIEMISQTIENSRIAVII